MLPRERPKRSPTYTGTSASSHQDATHAEGAVRL